ncbi:hypothetical protein C2R22_17565 [Salinigranum rubrum]|uniref:Polyprenyl synthetase n=1 Tax=Salinigranum rubrum TaxID=755307 RepID=A0A2I8VMR0_9EURY|nr:hypothetical protein [Salinigranum rubrum]AUV83227.1 hypothetical protein C2R22_17565 [Salinigranum rubrum]
MDDAARARDAAREALADIEPPRLRDALYDRLDDASMAPAVFSLLCARALGREDDADGAVEADAISERIAGVQLIYEGLRLTRTLAHDEPWETTDAGSEIAADLDMLAASVLVSRGFYLLARTDAADHAVETVRAFGRNQTRRREPDADTVTLDRTLEESVFVLGCIAGATAVDAEVPPALLEHAEGLAAGFDPDDHLPPTAVALGETGVEGLAALAGLTEREESESESDRVPSSATDP